MDMGEFMGMQGPVANPFNQNMGMTLQGLGTGYGNGQDMFDAYGDAVSHALKLTPFGNQGRTSGDLPGRELGLLSQFVNRPMGQQFSIGDFLQRFRNRGQHQMFPMNAQPGAYPGHNQP